ncbi:restriction endonuclease subunit S [Riemerella anatipestifer]|uniref:restriction endonuclease subunit S n=1 Tax=Riemerella anatipestifer TaxID=34085 RepID=UPI002A854FEF|nr:restriction endonuclease subunit S [Riemerella anatipestifer]MDY3528922.1 restriction endonuclease subunit S [Riemerella anatipestifer]
MQFDFPDESGKPYKSSGGKMVYNEILKREIPEGWEVKRLGEIIKDLESGKRPKGGIDKTLKEGIPSLGAESIDELGVFDFSSTRYIPNIFKEKIKIGIIKNNDILVYKDGAYVGKTTLFRDGFPFSYAVINEHIFLLRAQDIHLQNYLLFTLKQKAYFNIMQSLGQKAAQPGLNQEDLKSINILTPSQNIILDFHLLSDDLLSKIFKGANQIKELQSLRDTLLPMLMNGQVEVE